MDPVLVEEPRDLAEAKLIIYSMARKITLLQEVIKIAAPIIEQQIETRAAA